MGRLRLRSVLFSILKNMKTQRYLPNKLYLKNMVETTSTQLFKMPFKHLEQTDLAWLAHPEVVASLLPKNFCTYFSQKLVPFL